MALVFGLLVISPALAAPPRQDGPPTPTPTETPTGQIIWPTLTPSATLGAPPPGGGLAARRDMAVWVAPLLEADTIGRLPYGTVVYPVARSSNGVWVAISHQGAIRWVIAEQVEWDPNLDLSALPEYIPPFTSTPLLPTPAPTSTEAGGPSATPTPPPAEATGTPVAQPTAAAPAPTTTPAAALVEEAATPEPTPIPAITPTPGADLMGRLQALWPWIGGGLMAVLVVAYIARLMAGGRERRRYADGFVLSSCPVCQQGHLHLEETFTRTLGALRARRLVRCNVCRSVLREVEPGVWRYSIDPYINAALADEYNGQEFDTAGLLALAERAADFPPDAVRQERAESPEYLEIVEEILSAEPSPPPEDGGDPLEGIIEDVDGGVDDADQEEDPDTPAESD
ncbi:MAG: hypothetical protein P8Z40_00300 [Chloroflexota bacterium]